MSYDYSLNSAHAVIEKSKREEAERQVQLAKENKKDVYDAEMKALALETLKVAKQNQHTTNKTFWVAVASAVIGLVALILK